MRHRQKILPVFLVLITIIKNENINYEYLMEE